MASNEEMDPQEKLKAAKSIKEKGNDHFRRGELQEAQEHYIKVLDMLEQDSAFTDNDEKSDKDSLVLAAHLNLAQCALQLGDYITVVQHCNTVLAEDRTKVKAYYRRGKAFHLQGDYANAIADFHRFLQYDPENEVVKKYLGLCEDLLGKDVINGNVVEKYFRHTEKYHDMEIVDELKRPPRERFRRLYTNCKKNPGHKEFIPAYEFKITDLPPGYQDQALFNLTKVQAQSTVLLEVRGASENRMGKFVPGTRDPYPSSDKMSRNKTRYGSGYLTYVRPKLKQICPCTSCCQSDNPSKRWAEVNIETAAHVVFDDAEGHKTTCYFFYETDRDDLDSCPSLSCFKESLVDMKADTCSLTFICHEGELIDQLSEINKTCMEMAKQVRYKYNVDTSATEDDDVLTKMSKLHQTFSDLYAEHRNRVDGLNMFYEKLRKETQSQDEYKEQGYAFLNIVHSMTNDSRVADKIITTLGIGYKPFDVLLPVTIKSIKHAIEVYQSSSKDENAEGKLMSQYLHYRYVQNICERKLNFRCGLNDTEQNADYNEAHPLIILISHPHGWTKKITIGCVTKSQTEPHEIYGFNRIKYIYSNATCPGSSGGLVFILGQLWGYHGHPHSRFACRSLFEQRNVSAAKFDF